MHGPAGYVRRNPPAIEGFSRFIPPQEISHSGQVSGNPLDMTALVTADKTRHERIAKQLPESFWTIFEAVRRESGACQQRVLAAVRKVTGDISIPLDRAGVRAVLQDVDDPVRTATTRRILVDLSEFGSTTVLQFEFVDPIWAWARQALTLGESQRLHFSAMDVRNSQNERMYGGGIETGTY